MTLDVALAFFAGFAAALVPVWLVCSSLHGYVEWDSPWRMWANAVRNLFNAYTWRNRRAWLFWRR